MAFNGKKIAPRDVFELRWCAGSARRLLENREFMDDAFALADRLEGKTMIRFAAEADDIIEL